MQPLGSGSFKFVMVMKFHHLHLPYGCSDNFWMDNKPRTLDPGHQLLLYGIINECSKICLTIIIVVVVFKELCN